MAKSATKADGWINLLTGLGTARDKTQHGQITSTALSYDDVRSLWRFDDMAAKIIEEPARESLRQGFTLEIDADSQLTQEDAQEISKTVAHKLKGLNAHNTLLRAVMFQRAFGGALVLLGARDGGSDLVQPLNLQTLDDVEFLTVFDSEDAQPESYYDSLQDQKFGAVKTYRLTSSVGTEALGSIVHESRLLIFNSLMSDRLTQTSGEWGESILARVYDVLQLFGQSWRSAGALIADFSQAIFKIRGLRAALAANNAEAVKARIEMADLCRSVLRATLLDSGEPGENGEEFERKSTPLGGLPDLLDRMCNRLAAAADMPVTRLFGQSPAGLNATGNTDLKWWYDRIAAIQTEILEEPIQKLISALFACKSLNVQTPEYWEVKFNPLMQLTELEEADVRSKMSAADRNYVESGILLPEEVAIARFGGQEYSLETHADLELRDTWGAADGQTEPEST